MSTTPTPARMWLTAAAGGSLRLPPLVLPSPATGAVPTGLDVPHAVSTSPHNSSAIGFRFTVSYHRKRHTDPAARSEEHTSELQSLMRNSYAGFCLKKKN